ncbi:MAG TPA: hypothetical protein VGF87_09350 [Acidimicrobiales bacterium]|jgi:hypothetical protein
MPNLFEYVPHPRLAERKAQGPPKTAAVREQVAGDTFFGRLNAKVGLRITIIVGTMWAAYLFAAIALISLPENIHSTQSLILWISSSFLQLVLLPVIIVGQNIQAKAADIRAQATYNDAVAVLEEANQIQAHLEAQDAILERILNQLFPGGATGGATAPPVTPAAGT